jgi:TfoX/Sxy family transcriptional regulator of competence genes
MVARVPGQKSKKPPTEAFEDPRLVERVRRILAGVSKVKERRMFGGTGFMVRGNLCVTARPSRIMCRIDPAMHDNALKRKGCRTVVMKGREYKGYVHVDASAINTAAALGAWVKRALEFNRTLPEVKK